MKCKETVGLLPVKTLVQHKVQRYNFLCFHFLSISYKTKILQFSELQDFSFLFIRLLWSWRESNPRPNQDAIRFLHAYSGWNFREETRAGRPIPSLSSKISSENRGLPRLFPILPRRLLTASENQLSGRRLVPSP